jgi:hypothetical protein
LRHPVATGASKSAYAAEACTTRATGAAIAVSA